MRYLGFVLACALGVVSCSSPEVGSPSGDESSASATALTTPADPTSSAPPDPPDEKTPRVAPAFFGMHEGRVSQGVTPSAPVGSLRFWDSGTSWLHLETSPGQFSWGPLDTAVDAAESAGARPLLVLGQTPSFHASQPKQEAPYGSGAASMPELDAWRRYVTAVAERYGDRLDYQIWNETNVIQYWSGTPREMARLTVEASRAIRKVAPEAEIAAPPFALRLEGQRDYFEDFWSLQSKRLNLASSVDAVAVHLYPPAEDAPETQVGLLEFARGVLDEQSIELPVWNTEINFGLLGGPEPPSIPAERQRAFLVRAYLLNAGLGVQRVYWYSWNIGRIANTYLTEEDLTTETLAGRSFDVVRDWLEGLRFEGCGKSEDVSGMWECSASEGERRLRFWWKPRGAPVQVPTEDAASWMTVDDAVTRCRDTCRVRVGETPVMVTSR